MALLKDLESYLNRSPAMGAFLMVSGIALVGLVDLATGVELRIYPLYFLPLSLGAWFLGRRGAVTGTLLAAIAWYWSNRAAGMVFSQEHLWYLNVLAQGIAFLTVSLLIARTRAMLEREQQLSRTDALTGLFNSRAFYEQAEQLAALCRRHDRAMTLAYIDLDNFKCVNDRLGHARGDEVLRTVARTILGGLRNSDLAARIGGDEFVICLPETDEAQAAVLLERIRASLETSLAPIEQCQISASIGAVAWSPAPQRLEDMVHQADELMYEVKREGKNRVRVVTHRPG